MRPLALDASGAYPGRSPKSTDKYINRLSPTCEGKPSELMKKAQQTLYLSDAHLTAIFSSLHDRCIFLFLYICSRYDGQV
jgi:hypothetical protein